MGATRRRARSAWRSTRGRWRAKRSSGRYAGWRSRRWRWLFFFFQAEDGIRDYKVTGVQTCALPICMTHRPAELSGGEQQRCAVARALVHDPGLVLADEPSGNLDHANSDRLHDVFFRLAREYETAVVVVTHNRQLAGRADRIMMLEDGRLVAVGSVDAIP